MGAKSIKDLEGKSVSELEEECSKLKEDLAFVDSRCDTLSLYQGNEDELDRLFEQSNNLEDQIAELEERIKKLKNKPIPSKR